MCRGGTQKNIFNTHSFISSTNHLKYKPRTNGWVDRHDVNYMLKSRESKNKLMKPVRGTFGRIVSMSETDIRIKKR